MRKNRFNEAHIIGVLREQEAGGATGEICRRRGISEQTFYRWKARYGGMTPSDAQRLKVLEDENRRLKKLLAEAMLDVNEGGPEHSPEEPTDDYVQEFDPMMNADFVLRWKQPEPQISDLMARLPPTRATALASPLSAFPGWLLFLHCARCSVMREESALGRRRSIADEDRACGRTAAHRSPVPNNLGA